MFSAIHFLCSWSFHWLRYDRSKGSFRSIPTFAISFFFKSDRLTYSFLFIFSYLEFIYIGEYQKLIWIFFETFHFYVIDNFIDWGRICTQFQLYSNIHICFLKTWAGFCVVFFLCLKYIYIGEYQELFLNFFIV